MGAAASLLGNFKLFINSLIQFVEYLCIKKLMCAYCSSSCREEDEVVKDIKMLKCRVKVIQHISIF